jgi:hypothetical protein
VERDLAPEPCFAFDWIMKKDKVPMLEAPSDDQFEVRLERMKQRFALATLFFATKGEKAWKNNKGWLNETLYECQCQCQWLGCCFSIYCQPDYNHVDYQNDGTLRGLILSFNDLEQPLPREIGLLSSFTSLDL